MSKNAIQKATFKDLLNKKLEKEKNKNQIKDIVVTSMDRVITFKRPSDNLILEIIDLIGEDNNTSGMVSAFKRLIYHSCPMLQNTELHEELEIQDPYDTVDAIFELADIMEIGQELLSMININGKVEEIKN